MGGRVTGIRAFAVAVALLATLPGCASTPEGFAPVPEAKVPSFDALVFFSGKSQGTGELSKAFSKAVPMRVTSEGVIEADGSLTLTQRIEEGDKPPRERVWVIRESEPGRYEGTLTDASGPVEGWAQGNRLTLTYPMEGGFKVKQVLTLSADGARAYNRLKVTFMGVTVAILAEDIRRMD